MVRFIGIFLSLFILISNALTEAAEFHPFTHSVVAVATTSTSVVIRNTVFMLILQNDSDTTIYCTTGGGAAVVGQGIRLNSAGGSLLFDIVTPIGGVNCIHGGTGTKNLLVTVG